MTSSGLSAMRLRRMHDVLAAYVERGEVPGLVTLVSRRGQVDVDCIGYDRETIFRIASMTKPVTAAAAMILIEEGAIRLDDRVGDLLPELAEPKVLRSIDSAIDDTVPAERPITVRDLVIFTLGTGLVFAEPDRYPIQEALARSGVAMGSQNKPAADEFMRRLGDLPLVHQPGDVWMYNTGSDVLGILVERASKQSFGDFLRERIFEPLGMRETTFSVPADKLARLPTAYLPQAGDGLAVDDPGGEQSRFSRPRAFESGAGGLVSTVDDWLTFARMLLNFGAIDGARILSRPAVETMTVDHLTRDQKARTPWLPGYFDTHGWGFGVSVVTRRYDIASTPGKYGWEGGFGTSWYNDPREEMITIVMTQLGMTSPLPHAVVRDFWTLAYSALE